MATTTSPITRQAGRLLLQANKAGINPQARSAMRRAARLAYAAEYAQAAETLRAALWLAEGHPTAHRAMVTAQARLAGYAAAQALGGNVRMGL